MKTFNRTPANIDTSGIKNYSKYFNQMNFKGILEDENIYAIDQESLRDANNVYVNSDNRLVSRPTLQKDKLPSEIDVYQYDLIDIKYIGQNTIYINKAKYEPERYFILLVDKDNKKHSIQAIGEYIENFNLAPNVSIKILRKIDGSLTVLSRKNCYEQDAWWNYNALVITSTKTDQQWSIYIGNDNLGESKLRVNVYNGDGTDDLISSKIVDIALNKYQISTIEHYIICWNNMGAKIFDTNNSNRGWQDFSDFVEIPVTKTITGNAVSEHIKNEFTNQYKEQYFYTNNSYPFLPSGSAEVEVFTTSGEPLRYNIYNANQYTDYKISKQVLTPNSTYKSLSGYNSNSRKYILAIPATNSVYLSFNGGRNYTNIGYPAHEGGTSGMAISEDGLYYSFIANDGIYFLNLGDLTWSKDSFSANINFVISACIKTRQIYSFIARMNGGSLRLYFKGPSLYSGTDVNKDNTLSYIDQVEESYGGTGKESVPLSSFYDQHYDIIENDRLKMFITKNNEDSDIIIIAALLTGTNKKDTLITVFGGKNMWDTAYSNPQSNSGMLAWAESLGDYSNASINSGNISSPVGDDWVYGFDFSMIVDYTATNEHNWFEGIITLKIFTILQDDGNYRPLITKSGDFNSLPTNTHTDDYFGQAGIGAYYITPLKLEQGYLYVPTNRRWYFLPFNSTDWIDITSYGIGTIYQITVTNDKYFIRAVDHENGISLFTNLFVDEDIAILTYSYGDKLPYTKVPTISYSDTELYLAFDNLLQITKNTRDKSDVTKINFNLPSTNNQSFVDDITAIINISTTEVALFFLHNIVICSKVQDTNLAQGYRYDYYNTKLSVGVRLGDSVINTLEGQYTIFPTKRGLAVMNYQAFMATTDQVIEYITDNIRDLWNKFYEINNVIKIIQWNNKLIFTNNTTIMLLYDLDRLSWWKWELPINVQIAVTDHIDLRVINNNLNIFKEAKQYYDFSEIGEFKTINWFLMSQPLHMSAPNYYKNLKQLVFQFAEEDDNIVTKTMNAQIKLYRKKLSIKEPETIKFQIENLRTFVKRFNYWKINEIQWALGNDTDTNVPKQFELNAISIKYEIGDEVR